MVYDKMAIISLYFHWLGFWISDLIGNTDHLQTDFFINIQKPNFRSPLQLDDDHSNVGQKVPGCQIRIDTTTVEA